MVGVEGHRALLGGVADICTLCSYHIEVALERKNRGTIGQGKNGAALMEVKDKKILVVGLGKSGAAAALFLEARGARVTVSDSKPQAQLGGFIPQLLDKGIAVETGVHGERTFRDQDLIVVSPGVPVDAPSLAQARQLGIKIIGEVELASRYLQGSIIAITGSNGKTTTTTLAGEILAHDGKKVLVGGNIGTPVIELVPQSDPAGWDVLEISSFQLETIESFHPKISVILNVTPDHLDRHRTFENYIAAKARIFENQTPEDSAVLNADDAACVLVAKGIKPQINWFSRKNEPGSGAFLRGGKIIWKTVRGETAVLDVSDIPLKGAHNVENVLAAVCVSMLAGCAPERIREAVANFKAVEHRLEFVSRINGVEYYNDSKATNVDATMKALESFPANIHLILGGKDKGSDYSVLNDLLRQRVKRVYTIGAAAQKIEEQIAGAAPIEHCETLGRAVKFASARAVEGDVVVLAPACASFDQFENYEHRGRTFKEAVLELAAQPVGGGTR
jgi:UDP-N-acetylmuramoylalanine--D-glutamate ligase